jgi:hypothetical protein
VFKSEKFKDKRDRGNNLSNKLKRKIEKDNKDIQFVEQGKFKIQVGGLQTIEIIDASHFDE